MNILSYNQAEKLFYSAIDIVHKKGNLIHYTMFSKGLVDPETQICVSLKEYGEIAYFVLYQTVTKKPPITYTIAMISKKEVEQGYSVLNGLTISFPSKIIKDPFNTSVYYPVVLDLKEGPEIFVRQFNNKFIKLEPVKYFILKIGDMNRQDYIYDFRDELVSLSTPTEEKTFNDLTGKEIIKFCKTLDYTDLKEALGVDDSMWFREEVIYPEIWMTSLINKIKNEKNIEPEDFNKAVIAISNIYGEISRDYFGE